MNRTCGDCSACCTALAVDELNKPKGKRCQNLCSGGCSIYANRPQSCREFDCLWLQGLFKDEHRPDRLGIVFSSTTDGEKLIAFELWSGAVEQKKVIELLRTVAEKIVVIIVSGSRRKVMGPPEAIKDMEKIVEYGLGGMKNWKLRSQMEI